MNINEKFINIYLKLPRSPKIVNGKINVACIGDSITRGAGVRGKRELTWEYYLNELLGDDYRILNCGISGCTLLKDGDCPYVSSSLYPYTRDMKADVYLIMLGSNDTKPQNWNEEKYTAELKAFTEGYMLLENRPRVIIMIPPECFPDKTTGVVGYSIDKDIIDNVIPQIIRKTAEDLGIELIDLLTPTADHEEWYVDGVHPNAEGNRHIAELIAPYLK